MNGVQEPVFRRTKKAAGTDWLNLAPRVGFAWTPDFGDGLLGTIFGRGDETVFRGGWDITYFDEGTNMFASTAGNNTGQSQVLLLQPGMPGFTAGGLTLQSPLPPFQAAPAAYQDVWTQAEIAFVNGLGSMFSDLETGYVQSWNIGLQREIARNTVVEVRYLGNRANKLWHSFSLNEVNIFENGFLDEFKRAQQNLAVNEANGRTGFANNGLPGQSPIPIFEAAFAARGAQTALPGNQAFTNGNFISDLRQGEAGRLANRLASSQTYLCRMTGNTFTPCAARNYSAPGPYAANFFMVNPYAVNGLTVVDDDGWSEYQGLQLQLRRRYANWLTANVNYTLAKNTGNIFADNATQSGNYLTLRDKAKNDGPAPFDVRHVVQGYALYNLPFGRGRHFDISNKVLDAIAGGWTLGGLVTAQSGTPFRLVSGRQTVTTSDAGVVLMNGHTVEEIQNLITIRPHPTLPGSRYWVDPILFGPDGAANPEYLAPPTAPGEWGQTIYLRGRNVWTLDASFNKTTALVGRSALSIHVTIQNVLNHAGLEHAGIPRKRGHYQRRDQHDAVRNHEQPDQQQHPAKRLRASDRHVLTRHEPTTRSARKADRVTTPLRRQPVSTFARSLIISAGCSRSGMTNVRFALDEANVSPRSYRVRIDGFHCIRSPFRNANACQASSRPSASSRSLISSR